MKLHVAIGDHLTLLREQGVYRIVGPAQCLHRFPQMHRLDMPLMGQHGQLVQISAAGPQLRQDGLQFLYHMDGLPQGGAEQVLLLGLAGLSDLGVDLPPFRLRYPKGDDLMPLPVFHLFSPPHKKSGMGLSALQRNHTIPDFSVDSHTVLWELSESYQFTGNSTLAATGFSVAFRRWG